jgi:hypothetical protein
MLDQKQLPVEPHRSLASRPKIGGTGGMHIVTHNIEYEHFFKYVVTPSEI